MAARLHRPAARPIEPPRHTGHHGGDRPGECVLVRPPPKDRALDFGRRQQQKGDAPRPRPGVQQADDVADLMDGGGPPLEEDVLAGYSDRAELGKPRVDNIAHRFRPGQEIAFGVQPKAPDELQAPALIPDGRDRQVSRTRVDA